MFIGDSISANVDLGVLEKAMNANIKKVKAYSVVYDDGARYPEKNFTEVAKLELENGEFDILLLQSGSVDITNLDTKSEGTLSFSSAASNFISQKYIFST